MPVGSSSICALVSGGLDSAVLLHRLLRTGARIQPLYVRSGLSWEAAEVSCLRRYLAATRTPRLAPLQLIEMPMRSLYGDGAHWSFTGRGIPGARSADAAVYLPGRNALLLTHAAVFAAPRRITTLALGILRGNPFGDATPRFFHLLAAALTEALRHPVRLLTPLAHTSKRELVRTASAAGLPLHLTCSCIRPRGLRHCGRCNKCAERRRAFRAARITDPTSYVR